ncbi:MAG: PglZ domain-containing protein [Saprospiraceae bacterium]|nr:PglZ domain-containing protein [Saprospiraceae bacterium]
MEKLKILWADDEIDTLKPQIFFLEKKGFELSIFTNGYDLLEDTKLNPKFDLVFLDETMPGITGLETLERIRQSGFKVPVVLVTKNEAENIMEQAIGSQISDYLIKPINPNQLLLCIKKLIDTKRLVSEKNTTDYQMAFRKLFMEISETENYQDWVTIYKELIQWELKLDQGADSQIQEIFAQQKTEANIEFSKFINNHYQSWFNNTGQSPVMSHTVLLNKVFKSLRTDIPTIFILLDNMRFDQWKVIEPILLEKFNLNQEDYFYSILPTTTQYSRNSIFAGMLPSEIEKFYPEWWLNDNEEGGKNLKEPDLLAQNLKRSIRRDLKHEYWKITNSVKGKQLIDNAHNLLQNELTVIVYNFIDMLSHARTELEVLKELASDEIAYRSLTRSWFLHSPLWAALQKISDQKFQLIITTDHGTIRVQDPSKVVADRDTTTNLRYKVGKNLSYERKDVLEIKNPQEVGLPRPNLSSTYIFAKDRNYFLYPNNYGQYMNYYKNTFQHGGISMEEMICPIIHLQTKSVKD